MPTEITIVGAGIFGLSCAWELARRGAAVRVLEAATVGAGSSGGNVGALAPHAPGPWNPKKQIQLESLLAQKAFWAGVAEASGMDPGYARAGRLQPVARDGIAHSEAQIAAARLNWPDHIAMRLVEDPPGGLAGPGLWLFDDLTARLAPRRGLAALASAIRAAGGVIEEGCGALQPDALAGPVVWAAGAPGLALLSADLGWQAGTGIKGQSALLAWPDGTSPQIYADHLHVVPHGDGTVAIGSTSERAFTDPAATDALLDTVIARARQAVPALADAAVIERWAGIRPRAPSRAPLVGPWPGRPGHLIANGGFKIGFGMAPWLAGAVATLVLEGSADAIPADWRPQGGPDPRQLAAASFSA